MAGDAHHAAGSRDGLFAFGAVVLGDGSVRFQTFEVAGGRRGIDLLRGDRPLGQDGDHVVANLREPAVDEVTRNQIALGGA